MHLWINAKTFLKLRYIEERDLELAMLTLKLGSMIHRSHDGINFDIPKLWDSQSANYFTMPLNGEFGPSAQT
jgi:hypothetical protein